jgi:hypothetical protein
MPNHLHLATPAPVTEDARWALANLIGALQRSDSPAAANRWEPVEMPARMDGPQKISRGVRYIVLNPSRAGLAKDPLQWPWTTHRDLVGAVVDPWVTPEQLAPYLLSRKDVPRDSVTRWLHSYISSDPHVDVNGSVFPLPAPRASLPAYALTDIVAAAASATRATPKDVRRRTPTRTIFLHLAQQVGWRDIALLAQACDMTPRGVRWSLFHTAPAGLEAALLCLGDPRLRIPEVGHRGRASARGKVALRWGAPCATEIPLVGS